MSKNITCPYCHFRHPSSITCEEVRRIAHNDKVLRHKQLLSELESVDPDKGDYEVEE